jgi:hypothetical protein
MSTPGARFAKRKRPKSVSNDAYDAVNDMAERHRRPVQIEADWGPHASGKTRENADSEFPVQINRPNRARDTRIQLKSDYIAQQGGGINIGHALFDDKDLEAFEDIKRQKQQVSFESWLSSYFDVQDPPTAKIISEIYPEYWTKREASIRQQAELQTDLALIRLRGPTTKKDLLTLYALSTGAVDMPGGSIFEPSQWSYPNTDFSRGMFNPRRYHAAGKLDTRRDPVGALIDMHKARPARAGRPGDGAGIGGLDRASEFSVFGAGRAAPAAPPPPAPKGIFSL